MEDDPLLKMYEAQAIAIEQQQEIDRLTEKLRRYELEAEGELNCRLKRISFQGNLKTPVIISMKVRKRVTFFNIYGVYSLDSVKYLQGSDPQRYDQSTGASRGYTDCNRSETDGH